MGGKGTRIPPGGVPIILNNAGAIPATWPPAAWQGDANNPCWVDRVTVLKSDESTAACAVGPPPTGCGPPTIIPIEGMPLTYLYKPTSEGLLGDGAATTPNRFELRDGGCTGSNKVLLFVTGAAVGAGIISSSCAETGTWPNRVYSSFDSSKEQYYKSHNNNVGFPWGINMDAYTVALWFRAASTLNPTSDEQCLMGLAASPGPNFWTLNLSGDHLTASVQGITGSKVPPTGDPQYKKYGADNAINPDQWYHGAFTWNSASQDLTVYIDGVSQSVNKIMDEVIDSPVPDDGYFMMGARLPLDPNFWGSSFWYSGSLDEVSYWNIALNAAEVSEIYSSSQYCGAGPNNLNMHSKKDNLVSWWRMGEPPGPVWGTGIKDIAVGTGAAKWYSPPFMNSWGNDVMPAGGVNKQPTETSEFYLSGAAVDNGLYVGNCPWIAVSGAFANSNQNIVMFPGARVELTWAPSFSASWGGPGGGTITDAYWTTHLMHSGCYSWCGDCGPKAYLMGAIGSGAVEWPAP